jgi:hypothetical protein
MEHFGASSLDLPTILSLFPTIKLPKVGILKKDRANLKENESDGTSSKESTPSMENLEGKLSCHIPFSIMLYLYPLSSLNFSTLKVRERIYFKSKDLRSLCSCHW